MNAINTIQTVTLFIDYQNMYRAARRAFFPPIPDSFIDGQFDPQSMGEMICNRPPPGYSRILNEVRIYTGQPVSKYDPQGYSASRRQHAFWRNKGIEVISRPLRYPSNWPHEKEREKGIDVTLAIDFIALALDNRHDVGIIASNDTDLRPALEHVLENCPEKCRVEVTSWSGAERSPRLGLPGKQIWCHWLDNDDYNLIADLTNYTQ